MDDLAYIFQMPNRLCRSEKYRRSLMNLPLFIRDWNVPLAVSKISTEFGAEKNVSCFSEDRTLKSTPKKIAFFSMTAV